MKRVSTWDEVKAATWGVYEVDRVATCGVWVVESYATCGVWMWKVLQQGESGFLNAESGMKWWLSHEEFGSQERLQHAESWLWNCLYCNIRSLGYRKGRYMLDGESVMRYTVSAAKYCTKSGFRKGLTVFKIPCQGCDKSCIDCCLLVLHRNRLLLVGTAQK